MVRNGISVAIYDPSTAGGITHYTFQLAEGLCHVGCRVTLITSSDYELGALQRRFEVWYLFRPSRLRAWVSKRRPAASLNASNSPVSSPNSTRQPRWLATCVGAVRTFRVMAVLLRAAVKLRLAGTRIVHVHWILDRRADVMFIRTLQRLGIRVVYTVHNVLPHDEVTSENEAFFQRLYSYPDTLIVHSEKNRQEMIDLFSLDPKRLRVIPHGRHGIFFERFETSARAARDRLGIPAGMKVILFFGLIRRYKGVEHLLQAFDTIRLQRSDALLLIAGKVPENDPQSRRHYEPILAQYRHRPNVKFSGGYVPLEGVADYFLAADLVVIPYTKASQSGVLLTAYAAGRAVIATDVGGLGEVVKDGVSGLLVPPRDPAALAAAVITLLENDSFRERIGREAQRLAESTYSWTVIAESTSKVYESLLPGSRASLADSEAMVA